MNVSYSNVEPLPILYIEREKDARTIDLEIDDESTNCKIMSTEGRPRTMMVEIECKVYCLFDIPEDEKMKEYNFRSVWTKYWIKRDLLYGGMIYSGLFEKENYGATVIDAYLPNVDDMRSILPVLSGSEDDKLAIEGPLMLYDDEQFDNEFRIVKRKIREKEEYICIASYNKVEYPLYHIPNDGESLTLTYEEVGCSRWIYKDVISNGKVIKAIILQEYMEIKDSKLCSQYFRIEYEKNIYLERGKDVSFILSKENNSMHNGIKCNLFVNDSLFPAKINPYKQYGPNIILMAVIHKRTYILYHNKPNDELKLSFIEFSDYQWKFFKEKESDHDATGIILVKKLSLSEALEAGLSTFRESDYLVKDDEQSQSNNSSYCVCNLVSMLVVSIKLLCC